MTDKNISPEQKEHLEKLMLKMFNDPDKIFRLEKHLEELMKD